MYTTEDTTRCDPETVKRLYTTAIRCGARALVLCDTAGHATPMGTVALVKFVLEEVVKPTGEKIRVDWHGHCDRGLAVANSMAAMVAGADCVHATALGIGERVGNTQMDQMLVNLKLMGIAPWDRQDLTKLKRYCEAVSIRDRSADSGELSGGGRRRLPHRHRCARGRGHQGVPEERY
jgi:isopropylmalate/homocitrate/citramalate synthase